MIKVTDETLHVFEEAEEAAGVASNYRAGIEAVLKLIDPVPHGVQKVFIKKIDAEFQRVHRDGNVWRNECGCCYSTTQEIFDGAKSMGGEVTW